MKRQLIFVALMSCSFMAMAQIQLRVVIESGTAFSDCFDLVPPAEPVWEVRANTSPWAVFATSGNCFNSTPYTVYQVEYDCPEDVPATVEVCLRTFDNDAVIPCTIIRDCVEFICSQISLPAIGQTASHSLNLSGTGNSGGMVNFRIELSGSPDNDIICDAHLLGTLSYGDTLGNASQGLYNNYCATATGDPYPPDFGGYFLNDAGTWFRFNSGPNPSGMIAVDLVSDPAQSGDPIDLEALVFTAPNGCNGPLTVYPVYDFVNNTADTRLYLYCPAANTDYYIFVDGGQSIPGGERGVFGLQVWDIGETEGGDLRCAYEDLGTVPAGGSVATSGWRSNFCAGPLQDPFVASFVSQHSVWFSFVAPPSGHVIIEGISDTLRKPIGVQIALYRSFNGSCNGFYSHIRSQYTDDSLDERMQVSCLFPGQRYFILIDGSGDAARGLFRLSVSDAGDITPFTYQDTTLCYGQQLQVANSIYTQSGTYNDTIPLTGSCYRVIVTELSILDSISVSIQQTRLAYSEGTANAQAVATATGGSGSGYTFSWCNGETGATAEQLSGGSLCCVTVTDSLGCTGRACFEVEYARPILPSFQGDSLSCFGDSDGRIVFSASSGYPPYNYSWQHSSLALNGSGSMLPEQAVSIDQLPAGDYSVTISDILFDTTFIVSIWQPAPLVFTNISINDASCFSFCDGTASVVAGGGSPPYQYSWSDPGGQGSSLSNACAGSYALLLTDANGCQADTSLQVGQPPQFIASIQISRPISCFAGRDGQLRVTTNGQPVQWLWSQGSTSAVGDSLSTGTYTVTVTNVDGCEATASAFLPQPGSPLTVELAVSRVISCHGATDGQLTFQAGGPFQSLSSLWSTGSRLSSLTGIGAGTYSLTVTSELGCTATDSILLEQPRPLSASLDIGHINCLTGPYGGSLSVDSAAGGKPPYRYALDEQPFSPTARWEGLQSGAYSLRLLDTAGCLLSLPVLINEPPELIVSLGDDQEIRLGDSLELRVLANSNQLLFSWPHLPGFSGDRLYVRPLETQVFRVIARDTLTFCEEEAYIRLTVDRNPRVYMPTAFSPNSDGVNDSYYPLTDNDVVQIRSLRIFSRGGQMVYEGRHFAPNDPLQGWDGNFRGQPMPIGIYGFVAEIEFLDGRTEFFKGEIKLMR